MEYMCRICDKVKPKHAFTSNGLKFHTCKNCKLQPYQRTEERKQLDEIFDFLCQTRISEKDSFRLEALAASENPKVSLHATLVLEASRIKAYKKGRAKFLQKNHPDLSKKMEEAGLAYS
jgi:hypothetical protein